MKKFFEAPVCSIELMLTEDILTSSMNAGDLADLDANDSGIGSSKWSDIWKL